MSEPKNQLHKVLDTVSFLPGPVKDRVASFIFSQAVPFVGTAGCRFEKVTREEVIVSVANRRKARNHIGQLHAAAMALIAETASGFVFTMNLPADKLNLIKSMKVNYLRRSKGKMTAVARITPEQVKLLQSEIKGELLIEVEVTDESGEAPINCEMLWAWVQKR